MAKRTVTATQAKDNLEPFGYKGPARWSSIDAFVEANPRAKSAVTANEGALIQSKTSGFDNGGLSSNQQAIQELADLTYLQQNTGVSPDIINAAYETLGIDSSNPFAFQEAHNLLRENGFRPGSQENFYGDNSAVDVAAATMNNIQQEAVANGFLHSTPENLEQFAGEINPDTGEEYQFIENNNQANQIVLHNALTANNIDTSQTSAVLPSDINATINEYQTNAAQVDSQQQTNQAFQSSGLSENNLLDIFQIGNKPKEVNPVKPVDPVTSIQPYNPYTNPSTGSGTVVGSNVPAYTPTTLPEQTVVGGVGTTEVGVPTYETNLQNQRLDFEQRGKAQQSYMQPQTIAEQQAAGTGDFAGKIEQVLYVNRQGLQQYITHINGRPTQPIPAGFYRYIPPFETTMATGGYVQGYQQGGYVTFSSTENRSSGGVGNFVAIMSDGSVVGEGSGLNTHGKAAAAGKAQEQKNKEAYDQQMFAKQNVDVNRPLITGGATLTPEELQKQQANLSAQTFVNPAGAITAAPVAYTDPNAAGTVMPSITGQALPVAPIVDENQIAQVSDVTQATMPSAMTPVFDEEGKPVYEADGVTQKFQDTGAKPPVTATGTQGQINQMTFTPATTDYTSQPVIGEDGKPVMEAVLDAQGNPVYEADGKTPKMKPKMQTALSSAATITGQQATGTSVSGVQAAQLGQPILNPDGTPVLDAEGKLTYDDKAQTVQDTPTRILQQTREPLKDSEGNNITDADGNIMYKDSELVSGSAVDQTKVGDAFGTGEVAAASVQDELATLMTQFDDGQTPAWAAGSMRKAMATLSARGLGASSMAGQAVIQAAMEAALPIAQIDASNKQQMALFKAEQRAKFLQIEFDQDFQAKVINASKVSEIANMNFSADQQVALENARMAQTVDLANLNNRQAVTMAEAAALTQLDMANLNNLQQAAVQNAQNFLQVDMTNLNNAQQMEMFKQQTLANSILTDAAAENAMAQFNATNEKQRDQFMMSMASQISQFNATQTNAMKQFNANETNAMLKYNSEIQNQREMFNAQQYAVIAQANAKWRQDTTTMNTTMANQSNFEYAKQVNGLTNKAIDQIWQRERDLMQFAVAQSESALERSVRLLLGDKSLEGVREQADAAEGAAKSSFVARLLFGNKGLDIFGDDGLFNIGS